MRFIDPDGLNALIGLPICGGDFSNPQLFGILPEFICICQTYLGLEFSVTF